LKFNKKKIKVIIFFLNMDNNDNIEWFSIKAEDEKDLLLNKNILEDINRILCQLNKIPTIKVVEKISNLIFRLGLEYADGYTIIDLKQLGLAFNTDKIGERIFEFMGGDHKDILMERKLVYVEIDLTYNDFKPQKNGNKLFWSEYLFLIIMLTVTVIVAIRIFNIIDSLSDLELWLPVTLRHLLKNW